MYRIPVLIALVAILAALTIGVAAGGSSSAHASVMTDEPATHVEHHDITIVVCTLAEVFVSAGGDPINNAISYVCRTVTRAVLGFIQTEVPREPITPYSNRPSRGFVDEQAHINPNAFPQNPCSAPALGCSY